MLYRREDWPERLAEFLAAAEQRRFRWGRQDCCLFACDAVEAMTGTDLAAFFRNKYFTEKQARLVMRRFAGGGVRAVAEKMAKLCEISAWERPLLAQRGDVALIAPAEGEGLGIVALDGKTILSAGKEHLARSPLDAAVEAWRIG